MRKAFLELHIAVFLAGFTGVLGRLITINAGMLVWWRLLITAASMWVLFGFQKKIRRVSWGDLAKLAGTGMVAAFHWVSFYASIKYSNVSVALVCFSGVGFFTAFLEPLLLRRPLRWREILLGLMVMAGIYIIFRFDPRYKTGILLGVLSSFMGALFPIFNRQMLQRLNAETLLPYEMSGGVLVLTALLPFFLAQNPGTGIWPGWANLAWLLVLAWVCSVWAFRLSAQALSRISAFTVNLTYNLEPVYGILLAFLIYQENKMLGPSFYLGLALIMLAVILQTLRVYHRRAA
jgi:drug/metabolite transporter (DMT)-like permease